MTDGSTPTAWFDESGHTGEDLLNANQPMFVLASSTVANDVAQELARTHFAGVKATELKHGALAGRERGRRQILSFLSDPRVQGAFGVDIWHKEFTLFTTLVEFWVEEAMRLDGIDLYDRGGNIGLSNLTYMALTTLLPRDLFRQHMLRYQTMMRSRTREAYGRFWRPLRALFDVADGLLRDNLLWFIGAEMKLGLEHLIGFPPRMLSMTQSSLLGHVSHWAMSSRSLRVVHDASSGARQGEVGLGRDPDGGRAADREQSVAAEQLRPVHHLLVDGELVAQSQVLHGDLTVAAAEHREESKQVEQKRDH